jgi:energy-converting hydrogenase Eha subunit A
LFIAYRLSCSEQCDLVSQVIVSHGIFINWAYILPSYIALPLAQDRVKEISQDRMKKSIKIMECTSFQPDSTRSCSGNGLVCLVPDIGCICNFGWTSLGDYSLYSSGPACLINYRAVRILSYFLIIVSSICSILIGWHYVILIKRKKLSWEYKNAFPFCFLILGISNALFGVLKVSYPDGQQPLVGRDVSVTATVLISLFLCFLGVNLYLQVIIQFPYGYHRMMSRESRKKVSQRFIRLSHISWFVLPASLIFCIVLFLSIAYPSQSKHLVMTHFILCSITLFIFGAIFCNSLYFLLQELKLNITGNSPDDVKRVYFRLTVTYYVFFGLSIIAGILYMIFGCDNFLFHLGTYFHLVLYTFVPPLLYALVLTVAGVSQNKQVVPTPGSNKLPSSTTGIQKLPSEIKEIDQSIQIIIVPCTSLKRTMEEEDNTNLPV